VKYKGIIGIYLAAGQSKRMNCDKLLLPFAGVPLGSIALCTALKSQLDHIVIVTSTKDLPWITPSLSSPAQQQKWSHIPCKESYKGQSYSLRCGLQVAKASKAEAIMILLADQPFISKEMIDQLLTYYKNHKHFSFIASGYQGIPLPPILFSYSFFPFLSKLQGDEGARQLLRKKSPFTGKVIEFKDAKNFYDIDTEEEYRRLRPTFHVPEGGD
jgi:molybdenum cofactor cytidylyltransferase